MRYFGPGLSMRKPVRAKDCEVCGLPIERPVWNQKSHPGKCGREWKLRNNARFSERQKKAKAFKAERSRIGKVKAIKPMRDKQYLAWIRTLACLLCRTRIGVEAAHSGPHGLSQKAPDSSALPLCFECHRTGELSYHSLGVKFFATHSLKPREELVAAYNLAYKESREVAA